jgi:hypothetical protein
VIDRDNWAADDTPDWAQPGARAGWRDVQPIPMSPGVRAASSIRGDARFASVAVLISAVLLAVDQGVRLAFGNAVDRALTQVVSAEDAAKLQVYTLVTGLLIVAFLVAAVAFILWLYNAYRNVEAWRMQGLRWSKGWTIGGWFVPVGNLFIPKAVVDTVRSASATPGNGSMVRTRSTPLVWAWWLSYLSPGLLSLIGAFSHRIKAPVTVLEMVLSLVGGVLAVLVIRDVTGLQEARLGER